MVATAGARFSPASRSGWSSRRLSRLLVITVLAVVTGLAGAVATATPAAAAGWQIRDLGSLGGTYSEAVAISGSIVVGNASRADGTIRAFAYDLAASRPRMIDLGTIGGFGSQATAV